MSIQINLQNILNDLKITSNHLSVETKLRPATVLQLSKAESKRIDLEMLNKILDELNKIAIEKGINKTYTVNDIFTYTYNEKSTP